MSRKSSNIKKTGSVPTSVSVKQTPKFSSTGERSMPGSGKMNPMGGISSKSMGRNGNTTC